MNRSIYQASVFLCCIIFSFSPLLSQAISEIQQAHATVPTSPLPQTESFQVPWIGQTCDIVTQTTEPPFGYYAAWYKSDPLNITCVIRFSPQGNRVLTITSDSEWERSSFRDPNLVHRKTKKKDASGTYRNLAQIWDAKFQTSVDLKGANVGWAVAPMTAWSNDGNLVAITDKEGRVRVFDPHTGTETMRIKATKEAVVSFSPKGQLLALANSQGAEVWDLTAKKRLQRVRLGQPAQALAFSQKGTMLALTSGKTKPKLSVVTLATQARWERPLSWQALDVAFSPDGLQIATAGKQPFGLEVWDVPRKTLLFRDMLSGGESLYEDVGNPK